MHIRKQHSPGLPCLWSTSRTKRAACWIGSPMTPVGTTSCTRSTFGRPWNLDARTVARVGQPPWRRLVADSVLTGEGPLDRHRARSSDGDSRLRCAGRASLRSLAHRSTDFPLQQIAQFPQSGRIAPEYGADAVREVIEGAYRIIYEVNPDNISVLAVIHGAQLLPPRPGP
jgi:hypothetical protein